MYMYMYMYMYIYAYMYMYMHRISSNRSFPQIEASLEYRSPCFNSLKVIEASLKCKFPPPPPPSYV